MAQKWRRRINRRCSTSECEQALPASGTANGAWSSDCDSNERDGSYARYYTFSMEEQSPVTIDLTSSVDTYLYLRSGDAISGVALHENDDIESGNTNSRITATLELGTYTIEATTYGAGDTGSFTLTVTGLDGATAPGTSECEQALPASGTANGAWSSDCNSNERDGSYSRYYTFSMEEQSPVTIDLTSSVDTYLYLRSGDATSGVALHENDDIESGNTNSRITATLDAGTYTIEATTYGAGETGSFTLTVSGLDGATAPGTSECEQALPASGTANGAWSSDCNSNERDGSYARYYTFNLEEQSPVTIDLTSTVDTYLYLRSGDAISGVALHENDDIESGNTNSRITATLDAGTYTIEATTYSPGQTGSFTLTVSGLGGTGAPTPGASDCEQPLPESGTASGSWFSDCNSNERDGSYARYFTFEVTDETVVTITLESSNADTYLNLWSGSNRTGTPVAFNDDHDGSLSVSEIQTTLAVGAYAIEATTYNTGETGSFTLAVSGLGGTTTPTPRG